MGSISSTHTGRRPGIRQRLKELGARKEIGYLFILPTIVYLLAVSVYPMITVFFTSLTDMKDGVQQFVGLEQYRTALTDPQLWTSVWNVLVFTLASTAAHLLLGLALALVLNETWFSKRLRSFMRGALILPWIFSSSAAALMWSLLLQPSGLVNALALSVFHVARPLDFLGTPSTALASLIFINTWKYYPFYMVMILGGLQAISQDMYEAAKIDGANARQRFWYITLPQLRQVLIAASTLDIITSFSQLDLVVMLTKGGPGDSTEVIASYMYKRALMDGHLGYGSAISVLMLLVLSLFAVFYLKGLTRKGEEGSVI